MSSCMKQVIFLVGFSLFFTQSLVAGGVKRKLESLCLNCSVEISRVFEDYQGKDLPGQKAVLITIPQLGAPGSFTLGNQLAFEKYYNLLDQSKAGKSLINRLLANQRALLKKLSFCLFYHIAVENLNSNEPLWEIEGREPHDLYGVFHSDGETAVIALNNYQEFQGGVYSFTHELFHLLDGHPWSQRVFDDSAPLLERVGVEMRAVLAEMALYQEFKSQEIFPNRDVFEKNSFHEKYLKGEKIDSEKLFDYTLESLYPTKELKFVSLEGLTTSYLLYHLLSEKSDGKFPYEQIRYTQDSKQIQAVYKENTDLQRKIKSELANSGGLKKWMETSGVSDLSQLRDTGFNVGGGPKSRNGGDKPRH